MCLCQKRCEGVNECEYVRHMRVQESNCLRPLERFEFFLALLEVTRPRSSEK